MVEAPPLPTLLSQVLVAFLIEFDNAFESRLPHTTARGPAAHSHQGPRLVSMPMWLNFMRFVDPGGTPMSDLEAAAALTNLPGLERWGYVVVEPTRPTRDPIRPVGTTSCAPPARPADPLKYRRPCACVARRTRTGRTLSGIDGP